MNGLGQAIIGIFGFIFYLFVLICILGAIDGRTAYDKHTLC